MPCRLLICALILGGALCLLPPPRLQAQTSQRCFTAPSITNCIDGRVREYWEQNGGLATFGYPITAARQERNPDTGQTYLTQWFERSRFEIHPENARPYDVLLGRLGDDRLKQQGRDWRMFLRVEENTPHFFSQTGYAIVHEPFWRYWAEHGLVFDSESGTSYEESLALFGAPLSQPTMETNSSGATVLTQWFERARFEDHGEQGVLLGLLGTEVYRSTSAPALPMPDQQILTFLPVADALVHENHPDSNFGTYPQLIVDDSPSRESYLKFELSDLSGFVSVAKLRVYVVEVPHAYSPRGGSIARMSDTSWVETQVTYNTRPAIDGPILSTLGPVLRTRWYEFDVTTAVTGTGTLSLGLRTQDPDGAIYASRETGTFAPQLIVTVVR